MPHSSTVAFLDYWRGLPSDGGRAPAREHFDPARLRQMMPQMIMLSTLDPRYRFRLSGGFLTALHGRELTDTFLLDRFAAPGDETAALALGLACRQEHPVLLNVSASWRGQSLLPPEDDALFRNDTLEAEIVLCPLRNPSGQVDRLVGLYQLLSPMPSLLRGRMGPYTLLGSRLQVLKPRARAHLQLIAVEGRRIA